MGASADATRELTRTLAASTIAAPARFVRDDIAELRRAFPEDEDFASTVLAVASRLRALRASPGVKLHHDLEGWRRLKFSSGLTEQADLRIIFRRTEAGLELRAFGHRYDPGSVYFRATARR